MVSTPIEQIVYATRSASQGNRARLATTPHNRNEAIMSALTEVERVAVAIALAIIFVLGILFVRRLTDAERRLANAERRLTDVERQSIATDKKEPIGFWHPSPA
jgi:hypothetical protein